MNKFGLLSLILTGSCVIAICGCGRGAGPETVDVVGTITMGGKPVEGANVIFHPIGARRIHSQARRRRMPRVDSSYRLM
jgi:hypothetical protein